MRLQKQDLEAGRNHDFGAQPGKLRRAVTGVIGDGTPQRRVLVRVLFDVVGQSLRALANRAVVDRV